MKIASYNEFQTRTIIDINDLDLVSSCIVYVALIKYKHIMPNIIFKLSNRYLRITD